MVPQSYLIAHFLKSDEHGAAIDAISKIYQAYEFGGDLSLWLTGADGKPAEMQVPRALVAGWLDLATLLVSKETAGVFAIDWTHRFSMADCARFVGMSGQNFANAFKKTEGGKNLNMGGGVQYLTARQLMNFLETRRGRPHGQDRLGDE